MGVPVSTIGAAAFVDVPEIVNVGTKGRSISDEFYVGEYRGNAVAQQWQGSAAQTT